MSDNQAFRLMSMSDTTNCW